MPQAHPHRQPQWVSLSIGSIPQVTSSTLTSLYVFVFFPAELKEHLQSFVEETNAQHGPGFIKVVRHDKQEGLIRSRVSGWRAASAPVVALFDAHVEFNIGWWASGFNLYCLLYLDQLQYTDCPASPLCFSVDFFISRMFYKTCYRFFQLRFCFLNSQWTMCLGGVP